MDVLIVVLLLWAMFAGFGAWVSTQKGREPVEGAILGLLFGPLGVLVAALLPAKERRRNSPTESEPSNGVDAGAAANTRRPAEVEPRVVEKTLRKLDAQAQADAARRQRRDEARRSLGG